VLKSLHIQNIALIADLEIEFGTGLNVLTGETGAGKSIIIGSLNFILGQKLNKSIIRQGANHARVDVVFVAHGAERNKITELCGVDFTDNTVIISRTLKADGKTDCRINGTVVTADTLRAVAGVVINIHGQHETETLLKPKNHVAILDGFGGQKVINSRNNYTDAVAALNDLKKQLKSFGGDEFERKRLIDMYQYQIRDIETANLHNGEDGELLEKKTRMQNFEKLKMGLGAAVAVESNFGEILSALQGIAHLDGKAEKLYETAKSVKVEIDDIAGDIESYCDGLEFDEEEYRRVNERLDEIKVLKRKYGGTINDILGFMNEARAKLELLDKSEEQAEHTKTQITGQEKIVTERGEELIKTRREVATDMEVKITTHLHELGMPSAKFRVADITVDEVAFMFTANAGQEPKPLANIISGGEMSRFMLALKAVTANIDGVGTIVFDEIDTGISGIMGHKIAEKITAICNFHQVIAVTHLAQIASVATQHYQISKTEEHGKTTVAVTKLNPPARKIELTRMVGGEEFVKSFATPK